MRFRRHQEASRAATWRLGLLFALVLLALLLAVNAVLAVAYRLSFPLATGYPGLFFETNTTLVLLFVLGGCAVETLRLREGGAHVARLAGARPVKDSGQAAAERLERRFAHVVSEMAIASRCAVPAAWVVPRDDAINAFVAGWQPGDAVVVVTRGALERLTREELQGVVAHEFSHLVNGDTRLNMRLIGLVWGLQMVFGFGERLARRDDMGRRGGGLLFGVALMAVGWLGWIAGRLLQAAVSRQREFLADASAVQYTRNVAGLGGALRKIAHQSAGRRDTHAAGPGASLAHLWLHASEWSWWASHPPLAERLRRLYGRSVEPLPAELLPAPAQSEWVTRLVPSARPASTPDPRVAPDAAQLDPLQRAEVRDAAAWREREALQRISHWNGAGQLRIALLALMAGTAEDRGAAGWIELAAGAPFAAEARRELDVLRPAARRAVWELLVQRMARAPASERRRLLHAAGRLGDTAGLRLRIMATRRRLRRMESPPRLARGRPLERLQDQARAATRALALALALDAAARGRWTDAAVARLCGGGAAAAEPVPNGPQAPSWRAAFGLRRLSPMDRPRVVRGWAQALPTGGSDDAALREALLMACWLLDTPLPAAPGEEAGAQWRSL